MRNLFLVLFTFLSILSAQIPETSDSIYYSPKYCDTAENTLEAHLTQWTWNGNAMDCIQPSISFATAFYNEETGKCDKRFGAFSFDLWYIRSIITVLFPPIGVFMAKGVKGLGQVLICCILTMLFYVPGLIYALIAINGSEIEIMDRKL